MEEWRKIENFNYSVSNYGNVKNNKTDKKIYLNNKGGDYLSVNLSKNNKIKRFYVHRLVATYFVKKDNEERKEVNHKDGNKYNNYYKNLEWVTRSENIRHALKNNLIDTTKISIKNKGKILCDYKVYSYNVKTKEVKEYNNIHDLFGEFSREMIYHSFKHKTVHKGFIFSRSKDFSEFKNFVPRDEYNIKINETKPIRLSRFIEKLKRRNLDINSFKKVYINKTAKGEKQYLFFKI